MAGWEKRYRSGDHGKEDTATTLVVEVAEKLAPGTAIDLACGAGRGLEVYPELHFHLEDLLWGVDSIVLYYRNQREARTAEFMRVSRTGKVTQVVAHYSS